MPAWVSLLTAASLALHLALGCDWHHAHAEEALCLEAEAEHHAAEHEHEHLEHHQHDVEPLPQDGNCEAEDCVYISISIAKVAGVSPTLAALLPPPIAGLSASCLRRAALWYPPSRVVAAVRPHLLYQVILI